MIIVFLSFIVVMLLFVGKSPLTDFVDIIVMHVVRSVVSDGDTTLSTCSMLLTVV